MRTPRTLLWQGVRVSPANHGKGFELSVACKNDGPTARVDRASAVEAMFTWSFSDKPPQSLPMSWEGFDDGGYIETGVFDLNRLCPHAEDAADKGTPSLDPTSPDERNGRYKREYTRGTGGRSIRATPPPRRWWTPR